MDALAHKAGLALEKQQHNAAVARGVLWGQRVLLAKPTTFMNLSGQAVAKLSHYYKVLQFHPDMRYARIECSTHSTGRGPV